MDNIHQSEKSECHYKRDYVGVFARRVYPFFFYLLLNQLKFKITSSKRNDTCANLHTGSTSRTQACLYIRLILGHRMSAYDVRDITFKSIDLASLPAPSRKISEESCEIPCIKLRMNGPSFNRIDF